MDSSYFDGAMISTKYAINVSLGPFVGWAGEDHFRGAMLDQVPEVYEQCVVSKSLCLS
jgi:hypothetical protein